MRVYDIRPEAPCCSDRVARECEVPPSPAGAPIDYRSLELVPTGTELTLEVGDEYAEVRVVGPRVHLRDEEDSHRWINRDVFDAVS